MVLAFVPVPSVVHTVQGPTPTHVNSWTYNPLLPGKDPVELVMVTVAAPVVVTLPIHTAPRCVAGGVVNWVEARTCDQVATPPPDTADTVGVPELVVFHTPSTRRFPRVVGVTACVAFAEAKPPEARVPTPEIVDSGIDYIEMVSVTVRLSPLALIVAVGDRAV